MSRLLSRFFFGKDTRVSGLIALCVVALIALGCTCGKNFDLGNLAKNSNTTSTDSTTDASSTNEDMPSKDYLDAIIAETTADFNYAVTLNDFSKMYEKASPEFKKTYTEEEFKSKFQDFVDKKKVIIPILSKTVTMEPELSPEPSIRTELGETILVVKGKYATKPVPMTFEYEYVKHNDEWQLLKLVVKLV